MTNEILTKNLTMILEDFDQNRKTDMSIYIDRIKILFDDYYAEILNELKNEIIEFVKKIKR